MARRAPPRRAGVLLKTAIAAGTVALIVTAVAVTRSDHAQAGSPTRFEPIDGTRYLGVSTDGTGAPLDSFLAAIGRSSVAIYNRWTEPMGSFQWILNELAARPAVTGMISWNLPGLGSQASIAASSVDQYLRARVAELEAYKRPIFLRINWEFNGCYYGWATFDCAGAARPGNLPRDYVAAWRHVAGMLKDLPNVTLVWSPTLFAPSPAGHGLSIWDYYPGDDAVGWIGMDAYPAAAPWDVMQHSDQGMDAIYAFALAHRKPVMLAEWGLNDHSTGDDPGWVDREMSWVAAHAHVKAALYFDYDNRAKGGDDYRLASFPAAAAALRLVVSSPSWLDRVCQRTCATGQGP